MFREIAIAAALLVSTAAHAEVVYTIRDDKGGGTDRYRQLYASLKEAKAKIVIDGVCASACGLVFSLVGHNQMCATDNARAGFHKATVRSAVTGSLLGSDIDRLIADRTTLELYMALPLMMQLIVPLDDWPDVYAGASPKDAVWVGHRQLQQIIGKCE